MNVINNPNLIYVPAARGHMAPNCLGVTDGVFRLPTDPLYFSTLTLSGIVVGSRYIVTMKNAPYTLLSTGVASSTNQVLAGISVYENPMLVDIIVRNGSNYPFYKEFKAVASINKNPSTAFILQTQD